MIGRKPENLRMIASSLADQDFDMIIWSGLAEDYDTLRQVCQPQKPDIVCVGDGLPPETRLRILEKLAAEYNDFNLPELPKYAYLRNVGTDEKPDVIAKIMASGDTAKIQELKDKQLGPYGTPKFVMEAVANFQSGKDALVG
eukprot:CAMPEP_0113603490 /NCGR_PEP_ID=MMETSP0017_2-20120614/1306_1 /TAXON_ID=2856 /ORGANISM="Cylindrotheca closterium" /LENGTH=141 /DNA_ID=CAMNT_0000511885 /DNA_START=81 /DNA_END=506 /DNA_ORIENTATION=+ /assembly_acc=CAM_ASM_000147